MRQTPPFSPRVYTPHLRVPLKSASAKPPALLPGAPVRIVSPAGPAERNAIHQGVLELKRLGYHISGKTESAKPDGYFAATLPKRVAQLQSALRDPHAGAVLCVRGGYGSAALLDRLRLPRSTPPKLLIGFSDITAVHLYLWQRLRWPSLYGPMVAAGFDCGAGKRGGYDRASFLDAASGVNAQWPVPLRGETLAWGEASGVLLGGCLTLLENSLGTPWELDTRGAILLLEDRAVRPYQLDRMLLHLAQAGKFRGVRGIILGDFPEAGPARRGVTIRDVCRRLLGPLRVPVVFGAPVGHTARPMLTIPLGVRALLRARGEGKLEILEPVVAKPK